MFISDNFSSFRSDEVSKFLLQHNIDWKFILLLLHGRKAFMIDLSEQLKLFMKDIRKIKAEF